MLGASLGVRRGLRLFAIAEQFAPVLAGDLSGSVQGAYGVQGATAISQFVPEKPAGHWQVKLFTAPVQEPPF